MDKVKSFISAFTSALSNCSLYSKEHASVDGLAQKTLSLLNEFFEADDDFEIMVVEGDLIINKTPIRDAGSHGINFIKRMKRKGLSRVDFLKGITLSELKQFIAEISATEGSLRTYPHIRSGVVNVKKGA